MSVVTALIFRVLFTRFFSELTQSGSYPSRFMLLSGYGLRSVEIGKLYHYRQVGEMYQLYRVWFDVKYFPTIKSMETKEGF